MRQPEVEARRWLAQARDDLALAEWLLNEGRFFDKGCFISQQAAEKALKAVLYGYGARVVLGHSVADLLSQALKHHPELSDLADGSRLLDRFYIPTRYPNGLPAGAPCESFRREDLGSAATLARAIVDAAGRILEQ